MKKIFSILFALVLVVSLGLAMASPVLADSRAVTPGWTDIDQVAAGAWHTVGVKEDGSVVAVGFNERGQCDVSGWADIDQVAAGGYHTVGLKSDGTVVAAGPEGAGGWPAYGQCDVSGWTDIDQIAIGCCSDHTVGLKSTGTVVATGNNVSGQCDVSSWTDITQVAVGGGHTVGLKSNNTVVAVGNDISEQCDVGNWTDITQVAAGGASTVGLKSDHTVVAVGSNYDGQCDVGSWTDIDQIAAGNTHTVGLMSGGIVVAVGDNNFGQCGEGVIETIDDGGTINALAEADIIVEVTGTATVIIYKYDSNPHAEALALHDAPASPDLLAAEDWIDLNKWLQVKPIYYETDTVLLIKLYYKDAEIDAAEAAKDVEIDEKSLRIRWYDSNTLEYEDCSPSGSGGVVTEPYGDYSGYMWVEVTEETYPTLAEAQASIDTFGGYGHPSEDFNGGFCSIATAAYGTDTAEQLDILREFRDDVLLPNRLGAKFVSLYYRASPPIADFISQNEVLRTAVRVCFVDPIVAILNWTHDLWPT